MTESPVGTASLPDAPDDSQLTIRIPNPKVFMARQSQWKGRRGKPRCDHCRLNNLKCDRVLPTCNHCSWANRECKYTPLPTPAHRGIPRCDRCRFHNLKCDRNLPVCNHCQQDKESECNYTPKKRHKVPTDHGPIIKDPQITPYAAKTASFLISDMPPEEKYTTGAWIAEHPESPTKGRLPNGMYDMDTSGSEDDSGDEEKMARRAARAKFDAPWMGDMPGGSGSRSRSSGPLTSRHGMPLLTTRRLEPWYHPAFAPLPRAILMGMRTVNPVDMPSRQAFDEALYQFLSNLPPELKEVAAFTPDVYAEVAQAIAKGDTSPLSERLQRWTSYHHVHPGSRKYHLLLLPREAFFAVSKEKEEKLRIEYIAEVDGDVLASKPSSSATSAHTSGSHPPANTHESSNAFLRIPVSTQIYDVLAYAHKNHHSAAVTLSEIRKVGIANVTWPMVEIFYRLCPTCSSRGRPAAS
ncbi:hypothetical protein DENSPDRAFT_801551 [Dentipellis sp. KUC8613]|nr:hypothetical protein DENSPDRAFT_801551 [Dentipellis sp. KUC8613]